MIFLLLYVEIEHFGFLARRAMLVVVPGYARHRVVAHHFVHAGQVRVLFGAHAEGQPRLINAVVAVVLVGADTEYHTGALVANDADERLKPVILKIHLDTFTFTATDSESVTLIRLEYNLHNRLGVTVLCSLPLPVLKNADVVLGLEVPCAAKATVRAMFTQWNPISLHGVVLADQELHGAKCVVHLVDAVVNCAYVISWLPLINKDLAIVDPVAVTPPLAQIVKEN